MRAARVRWLGSLVLLCGACGGRAPSLPTVTPPPPAAQAAPAPAPPASPTPDPIAALIATAERHYTAGQRELANGHLDQARREFDRSVSLLLESSAGARADARLRDYFDRLVDRISAHEALALVEGDGFSEGPSEPAPIDELLAIASTFQADPQPAAETTATVRADLARATHDIPIPLNDRVLATSSCSRAGCAPHPVGHGSRRPVPADDPGGLQGRGLPLDLAYIPLIESAFKPAAQSQKRARGVWQFMRATGEERGLETNWFIDERSDPEKSTKAAADYLKWLHSQFGDWHLALASYNGGPGRVQRAMKKSGIEDFWRLSQGRRHLPRETREYVPLILAAMVIARNPTQYRLRADGDRQAARLRFGHRDPGRRSAPHRRVDRRAARDHPGAQPRAAAVDDARARRQVRRQGAGRHRRQAAGAPRERAGERADGAALVSRQAR